MFNCCCFYAVINLLTKCAGPLCCQTICLLLDCQRDMTSPLTLLIGLLAVIAFSRYSTCLLVNICYRAATFSRSSSCHYQRSATTFANVEFPSGASSHIIDNLFKALNGKNASALYILRLVPRFAHRFFGLIYCSHISFNFKSTVTAVGKQNKYRIINNFDISYSNN